jgi:hypothetical protein
MVRGKTACPPLAEANCPEKENLNNLYIQCAFGGTFTLSNDREDPHVPPRREHAP